MVKLKILAYSITKTVKNFKFKFKSFSITMFHQTYIFEYFLEQPNKECIIKYV